MGFVPVLLQSTVLHTASKEQALAPLTRSLRGHAQPKQCDGPEDPASVVLAMSVATLAAAPRRERLDTARRPEGVGEREPKREHEEAGWRLCINRRAERQPPKHGREDAEGVLRLGPRDRRRLRLPQLDAARLRHPRAEPLREEQGKDL